MTDQAKPTAIELAVSDWRKSSFSGPNNCVEVAHLRGRVAVRDSKNPGGSPLVFSAEAWATFLAGAKSGEFDPS